MMVIMALVTTCMTGPALDLIDKLMPQKKWEELQETALASRFSILIAFASPQSGRKMLRLANNLVQKSTLQQITALHLTPSSYLNQINTEEYQFETFQPVTEEAKTLNLPFVSLFKPSQNIVNDIIETANNGEYDMLLIGIGHTVFEGTFLGRILGFTSKIISRNRLFDTLTGKEKLFHADIFDERTTHIIKSVKLPIGIFIEKNLEKVENVFLPIFSVNDLFLLEFASKLLVNDKINLTIMNPAEMPDSDLEIRNALTSIQHLAPEKTTLHTAKALEKDFLSKKDLMIISLNSWKKAVESHSLWLSHSPSVLILRN